MSVSSYEMVEFLRARIGEDRERAEKRLCINCGGRTAPLRSPFGITGYIHDSWNPETGTRDGWEGQRCPNRLTGAEPVQGRARALREVEAKRAILARCEQQAAKEHDNAMEEDRTWVLWPVLFDLAAVYSDHPDYRQEWKP